MKFKTKKEIEDEIVGEDDAQFFVEEAFADYCGEYNYQIHEALRLFVRLKYEAITVCGPIHLYDTRFECKLKEFFTATINDLAIAGWKATLVDNQLIIEHI